MEVPASSSTLNPPAKEPSTASHPDPSKPDPTETSTATGSPETFNTIPTNPDTRSHDASGRFSSASTSGTAQLANLRLKLRSALRQFPDFPQPGILFEDIMPIFADPQLHEDLLQALLLHIQEHYGANQKPDVIVGLEARGFLFGPSLALRLGAAFVPVRKAGKLPGPTETVAYQKEYGQDLFQMQKGAIKQGQRVLIVDDIIATGGTAAAAGTLVHKEGGSLIGYTFILELDFLKGRAKLDAPVFTLLASQEAS